MMTEALGFLWSNQKVVFSCRKHTDSNSDGAVNKCLLMNKIWEEERQWREKELSHSIRVILIKPLGWSVFEIIYNKLALTAGHLCLWFLAERKHPSWHNWLSWPLLITGNTLATAISVYLSYSVSWKGFLPKYFIVSKSCNVRYS